MSVSLDGVFYVSHAFNGVNVDGGAGLIANGAMASFEEVSFETDDARIATETVEALRGTALTVPRGALPPLEEGEYYHADLIGLPVVTEQGEAIGTVADVMNYGATDLVEIERANGKKFMVPLTEQAVPEWNDERLVVNAAFAED